MKTKIGPFYLLSAFSVALIISLMVPAPVVADDTPPAFPEPSPTESADLNLGGGGEVATSSTQDEISESDPAFYETPLLPEPTTGLEEMSTLLGDLPENTQLMIVVDGQVEPLATQQAEQALAVRDPIWCPENADPDPGLNGCTASFATLSELITHLEVLDPDEPGTIWIEDGADASPAPVIILGGNYSFMVNHDLTIQGGWDNGNPVLGTISGESIFSVPIVIEAWGGGVTINQISIDGSAGLGTGLDVEAAGEIVLQDITSESNTGFGATLISQNGVTILGTNGFENNSISGLSIQTTGDVYGENITALNNLGDGVYIEAGGNVTLVDLVSNVNTGVGAYLQAGGDIVVVTAEFDGNDQSGASLESGGSIFLDGITSTNNGLGGVFGAGTEILATGDFVITGVNEFSDNLNYGLFADVGGNIFAENITASGNGVGGGYGPGAEFVGGGTFNLSGLNEFSDNSYEGLIVDVAEGITIHNTDSIGNGGSGMFLSTNGNAHVECGQAVGNTWADIDTSMSGTLTLAGVDFGNDLINIGIDESQLLLISNGCFTYPDLFGNENEGGPHGGGLNPFPEDPALILKYVSLAAGQTVDLDCANYQATYIVLENGDGAIIPCPIIGKTTLDHVQAGAFFKPLPEGVEFISGMDLEIIGSGALFNAVDQPDIIWFANPTSLGTGGYEAVYWDGVQWVDITDRIPPFLTIFFRVPDEMRNDKLTILHWDGQDWVELSSGVHLGNGRIASDLGRGSEGAYYQVNINFIGTFVLVKK